MTALSHLLQPLYRGDSRDMYYICRDDDGAPMDLSLLTATLQIGRVANVAPEMSVVGVSLSPLTGIVLFQVLAADTAALVIGWVQAEIVITETAGGGIVNTFPLGGWLIKDSHRVVDVPAPPAPP